jgi:formamidopyrimidine-DNA glycosylase
VPELIEVELYRRLAERAVDRRIERVDAPDSWFLKGGLTASGVADVLVGERFTAARRRGKLMVLDTHAGPTLGIRFGMTGRLLVDEQPAIERLEYASGRDDPAWDRFTVGFEDGGTMRVPDPRRLGGIELDPDEERLGPDAAAIGAAALRDAVVGSSAPLKGRLMDQKRVAGLGNLLTDEILWRAALDPARPCRSLNDADLRRLHRHVRSVLDDLTARGGSHLGDLQDERSRDGCCPKDGMPLDRRQIGGRTTYSCPHHQR